MRPVAAPCGVCQCTWCDSDCVHVEGNGTDKPITLSFIADPDSDNLFDCGPQGGGVFLPPDILDPPVVHAYRTVRTTIPNEAAQILFFNETRYDTDSMHDTENDQSRLTINTPGIYLVTLNVTWNRNEDGDRAAFIRRNGADFLALESKHAGDADLFVGHSLSIEENFEAGDYLEAMVKQDSGTGLGIEATRYSPVFSAMFMRQAP